MAMRYMMMVKGGKDYEAGVPREKELVEAIAKHGAELAKAGILLDTGGLMPTSKGARILASAGNLNVIDGPFSDRKSTRLNSSHSQISYAVFCLKKKKKKTKIYT